MSSGGWTITYTNGDQEQTPEHANKLQTTIDGTRLLAVATRTYGSDETLSTYVLANVRKWEPNR